MIAVRAALAALFGLMSFAVSAGAQSTLDSVAPRTTVRVWSSELGRRPLTAVVLDVRPDSLDLQRKTDPRRSLSRGSITRLDVSIRRTRKEGARFYGLFGLASGALNGVTLGLMAGYLGAEYYPNGTDEPGVSPLVFSVPLSMAIGGVGGALAGAAFPGSRWRTVIRTAR